MSPSDAAKRQRRELHGTFVALLVLTLASWGIAHLPLGRFGLVVGLVIACIKAVLVGLVFMELASAARVPRIIALCTLSFIALLCAGMVCDVALR